MQISIPCETYSRMAEISANLDDDVTERYLQSMYFERKDNHLYCVVSNKKIAAIEHLGINEGPNEWTCVTVDRVLIDQCDLETKFSSNLEIVANDALAFTAIRTTFGYNYSGNGFVKIPVKNWLVAWREWFPEKIPTETNGAMYWGARQIQLLAIASKSGSMSFPEFIDASKPVVINDAETSDWVGLFMPNKKNGQRVAPAIIPDWL